MPSPPCALSNTDVFVQGHVPQRAITLEITSWKYLHIIMGLTMGVQLLVSLGAVFIANRAQVREQRSLANTTLLRPLLSGVTSRASMAKGRQIAKLIGKNVLVRYEPVGGGYGFHIYRDGKEDVPAPINIDSR